MENHSFDTSSLTAPQSLDRAWQGEDDPCAPLLRPGLAPVLLQGGNVEIVRDEALSQEEISFKDRMAAGLTITQDKEHELSQEALDQIFQDRVAALLSERDSIRLKPIPDKPKFASKAHRESQPARFPVHMKQVTWVLISGASEGKNNMQDRVIPAAETFLSGAPSGSVIAVFGKSSRTFSMLAESDCQEIHTGHEAKHDVVEYSCPTNGATVVALVLPCLDSGHALNAEAFAAGPCCKYSKGVRYLSDTGKLDGKDWVSIGDDDIYVHASSAFQLLGQVEPGGSYALNIHGDAKSTKIRPGWNKKIDKCEDSVPQGFLYSIFSRGLIKRLVPSIS
jgi:hypothetical protein